jgi:tetratricopeptide (TPR) repeat protein
MAATWPDRGGEGRFAPFSCAPATQPQEFRRSTVSSIGRPALRGREVRARVPAAGGRPLTPPLSRRRRWLLTGLMLAVPVLVLLGLELGLRMTGYGDSYPLFVAYPPQPEYRYPNQQVARRYFRERTITPVPHLDFFRAEKQPGTFRIVFQGESSAAGFPYRHGAAPSRMLEQRLQATFPDRRIEVINTALTAVNSYTLLDFADEIIAQRPDAVLIYTGHNEYYGVFGVASTRSVGSWRPAIEAYLALRHLRTVQLLDNAIASAAAAVGRKEPDLAPRTVMELLAGEQRVPLGSRLYEQGLEQFRANLSELLSRYHERGIPVLIGTVASNERDQRPFVSALRPGTDSSAWWGSYGDGLAAMARGDAATAERALEAAIRVDSTAADAFYALGQLFDALGDSARAHANYRAAKDRDQLRFRAPEAINRIIRDEAARNGATVVETQQAVERASPRGIVGKTLILEHLHPNIEGYFVIADAFYDAVRQRNMIGPWDRAIPAQQARMEIPVTAVDSLAGLFRVNRLVSGWPFQPKGRAMTPIIDTLHPRTPVEQLARDLAGDAITWPEAMERLRKYYEGAGDWEHAIGVTRAMSQEYRYAAGPYMDAGRIALTQRRYDDALRYIRAANERRETANSVQLLGLLLLRRGDHESAVQELRRATQLAPRDERMQITLAAAEAIPELERERSRSPRNADVLFNLAGVYALTQQYDRSKEALAALRHVDPTHAGARELSRKLPP